MKTSSKSISEIKLWKAFWIYRIRKYNHLKVKIGYYLFCFIYPIYIRWINNKYDRLCIFTVVMPEALKLYNKRMLDMIKEIPKLNWRNQFIGVSNLKPINHIARITFSWPPASQQSNVTFLYLTVSTLKPSYIKN